MTGSRPALLLAAAALIVPIAPAAYASTAQLQIRVVVVRSSVVPVRPAAPDRAPAANTPPGVAARLAPAGAGTGPVLFTDGAPPAFVIRTQTPPRPERRGEPSS